MQTKCCIKCKKTKSVFDFYKENRRKTLYGVQNYCKLCEFKRKQKAHKKFPLRLKQVNFKRRYKLTLEQYDLMLKNQKHKCEICKKKQSYNLYVDHNHITKSNRGLLCRNCNFLIGHAKENTQLLKLAIEYIKQN